MRCNTRDNTRRNPRGFRNTKAEERGVSRDGRADEEAVVDNALADVELGQLQQSIEDNARPETVP
eukprot:1621643-Rhodomonas_salina.3